jgi:hypothetical protein
MFKKAYPALLVLSLILVAAPRALAAGFTSDHFRFIYDERQLPSAAAETAARDAERAYTYNQEWFPTTGPRLIQCDLTPRFFGATGYAQPDRRPPRVAVRIPDLEYLGLEQAYVLRHEVAHVFSGRLASGPMGEGLADLVAGGFGDLPLSTWWGGALREAGLWVYADGLFLTGEYPASTELDARQRVAAYTEPALLLQFLVDRFGTERVLGFLPEYSRARRTIESNEAASRRRGYRRPDAAAVQRAFREHFGRDWTELRQDWEAKLSAKGGSEVDRRRLVIGQKTYAAIRNFEMWLLAQRGRVDERPRAAIRRAFTEVNSAIRARRLDDAEVRLRAAQGLVNELKRPMLVARASFLAPPASNLEWSAALGEGG